MCMYKVHGEGRSIECDSNGDGSIFLHLKKMDGTMLERLT